MIKKTDRRLSLHTETIRELRDELRSAAGGAFSDPCLPPTSHGPYKCPVPPPKPQ